MIAAGQSTKISLQIAGAVRRQCIDRLWRVVADAWNWPTGTRPARESVREWAEIGSRTAETRSLGPLMITQPYPFCDPATACRCGSTERNASFFGS